MTKATFFVKNGENPGFSITLNDTRNRWALERHIDAGAKGITAFHDPSPRWHAYIHNLKAMGLDIVGEREPHGGKYPGTHKRYFLKSTVSKIGGRVNHAA